MRKKSELDGQGTDNCTILYSKWDIAWTGVSERMLFNFQRSIVCE